jgi:hypothetical protein
MTSSSEYLREIESDDRADQDYSDQTILTTNIAMPIATIATVAAICTVGDFFIASLEGVANGFAADEGFRRPHWQLRPAMLLHIALGIASSSPAQSLDRAASAHR